MSKEGKWKEMGDLITDEILHTFAVVAEPEKLAAGLDERYGDIVQRLSFYAPYASDPDRWRAVMAASCKAVVEPPDAARAGPPGGPRGPDPCADTDH